MTPFITSACFFTVIHIILYIGIYALVRNGMNKIVSKKCNHVFKIIHENQVFTSEDSTLPVGFKFTSQCVKCGKIDHYKNY